MTRETQNIVKLKQVFPKTRDAKRGLHKTCDQRCLPARNPGTLQYLRMGSLLLLSNGISFWELFFENNSSYNLKA